MAVTTMNETGVVELVFFHVRGDYVEKMLPMGATRIVSGRLNGFRTRSRSLIPIISSRLKRKPRCLGLKLSIP